MLLAQFDFKNSPLEFYKAPNGLPVVSAASLVKALKGYSTNAARIARNNVREKWLIEIPTPNGGKPKLCLFEPGAYQLAGNPMFQTELAEEFQDWLFEKVLPKLRASGYYVMPTATSEQLEAVQKEIHQLKERIEFKESQIIKFCIVNQKLMDTKEKLEEGELKQLVNFFGRFAVKDYTSYSKYSYPFCLIESYSDRPPYSFERYWLAFWKVFKRYSQIKDFDYQYHGALYLNVVDTWQLLLEVDKELRYYGQYNRLKQRNAPKPCLNAYQQVVVALEL